MASALRTEHLLLVLQPTLKEAQDRCCQWTLCSHVDPRNEANTQTGRQDHRDPPNPSEDSPETLPLIETQCSFHINPMKWVFFMQYMSNRPANPCLDFQAQMWLGTATPHGGRGCVVHGAREHFSEQLPRLWNLRWTATTNQPCHWEFSEPTFRISSEGQPSTHVYIQACRKCSLSTLVSALKGNT